MVFPGFISRTLLVLLFSCIFGVSAFAAGSIPRTDLRLELMLATGSQDTSGNGRIVTTSGSAMTFLNDTTYGIPFGKFTGSGGLRVNTGWSTVTGDFTVSFWARHPNASYFLTGITNLVGPMQVKYYKQCDTCSVTQMQDTYNSDIAQTIFTTGENGEIKMIVDANGKCSIRGGTTTNLTNQIFSGSYYINTYKIFDAGTNMQESFNCPSFLDNKWHNIILTSNSSTTSVFIDGVEIIKLAGAAKIGRYLSIGSSDTNMLPYSNNLLSNQINIIRDSKFLRGYLSVFRIYSRALTIDEREALLEEFRYAQSDLAGAGGITVAMENYTKPNLYAKFKNIPLALSKDNVTYEYTTDGQNFTPITNITDISTTTGSIDYRIGVDLSSKPDGRLTLTFRIRTPSSTFQNIGTIAFSKTDIITTITINMPSSDIESAKTITASAPTANLYMYQTTGTICDATIGTGSFEDYYDITFTNSTDNGKRVCYKAVYPSINKTIYKLSAMIQGIQTTEITMTNINNSFFTNYLLWTKSAYPKTNDTTYMILDLLNLSKQKSDSYGFQGQLTGWSLSSSNPITMTDINGDGLVDFLYSHNEPVRRAIIINNGNFTFRATYKCAIEGGYYYGDCADTTR